MLLSLIALSIAALSMLLERQRSRRNERELAARGAIEVEDPVYRAMQWAYPGAFMAMAVEGIVTSPEPGAAAAAGAVVFVAGKALKYWAIGTLGVRWTYRVHVLPGAPLVTGGPYRLMTHPNYVGVVGELVGMALLTGARWTGPVMTLYFCWLLRRRMAAENRALGIG